MAEYFTSFIINDVKQYFQPGHPGPWGSRLRTVADFLAARLAETPRSVEGEELLEGTEARVCNLGDSRTFLVRRGEPRRLTGDHTSLACWCGCCEGSRATN
ncbi:PP2C family serine/threonine-protein phosphatase [Archangium violaceum]|uniref:PP2C family serine/threonine-protein phosphatase n=1 Tax=Archangium violaceum TaxID=83451 RepID=UPI0036DE5E4E